MIGECIRAFYTGLKIEEAIGWALFCEIVRRPLDAAQQFALSREPGWSRPIQKFFKSHLGTPLARRTKFILDRFLSNRLDGGRPRRYIAPLADIPCSAIQLSVYNLPSPGT